MYYYPYFDYRENQSEMITDLSKYTYPKNYQNALNLMKSALGSEKHDELFYNYLVSISPNEMDKEIIGSIRDDEIKHNKMFRTIYYQLTGTVLPYGEEEAFNTPPSFCQGLIDALKGELGAVQKYRQILFGLENRVHINMLTEIITDELRHSGFYNLLITRNRCF